jgi:CheY-like chemotaxis protein
MMIAAREKPDLITLDFKMPAGDGGEVLKRLRANTFTAKTKIVFVTGMNEYDLDHSVPVDPDVRYIQKPIDVERLRLTVSELLGAAEPAETPRPEAPPAPKKPIPLDGGAFGGDILDSKLP